MKNLTFALLIISGLVFTSCNSDDDTPPEEMTTCTDGIQNGDETGVDCGGSACQPCQTAIDNPATFVFIRNGESTVSFSGQTTRILMGEELIAKLKDETTTEVILDAMFAHEEGNNDFSDMDLNASDKSIRSKTAASNDFFSANTADQALIRADFEAWIKAQVDDVFPSWNTAASAGVAGQIADGSSTRYINAQGLEYNQLINKGLIGALMVDQALNNYLGTGVLDAGDNVADNDAGTPVEGKPYTNMEHKWDEAYGYTYGLNADEANPNADLGNDSFLNKYIGRVQGDDDFNTIADDIFQAFKLGRAAIVAGDYTVRDEQAEILRGLISDVVGIRAVYYLQQGKNAINQATPDFGGAFHDLSEGYGFIYSLQFTRKPNTNEPYFTKAEVDGFLTDLLDDGANGLWDVTPETLDAISEAIAARFDFTVTQAGS
ncbi:DUF4856 domain-containing protein [uncultured Croceitalea sp.]|uniref:DUF4856 domain-containing protein n=1 Tax=uncultured Croceitalea sp. TaxID=1798908 RepID=UPI00374E3294